MHEKRNVDAMTFENIYHPFTAATQMQHVTHRGIQTHNIPCEAPKDIELITLASDSDIEEHRNTIPEFLVVPETDEESDVQRQQAQDTVILTFDEHSTAANAEFQSGFRSNDSEVFQIPFDKFQSNKQRISTPSFRCG